MNEKNAENVFSSVPNAKFAVTMKNVKIITIMLLALLTASKGFSQITITDADMPSVNDTFRVSNGLITPAIDPVPTGLMFVWDFSMLQWISQDVDSFISVASTGPIYSVVFINLPFNPYRANMAARGPDLPSLPQVTISDVNYFYYNSSAAYELSGYGAVVNGVSLPIPFNNKDRIYDFPLNIGNTDSSDSDYQISLPGLGFYGHNQHRVNEVDGWGTLITPYGLFDALRVKSVITSNDSIFLDTLGIGFGFSLPQTIEYKWLGAQQGIPLLQINTTISPLGTETVSSIRYRDSLRVVTGISEGTTDINSFNVTIYPNPVQETMAVELNLPRAQNVTVSVYNTLGEKVAEIYSGKLQSGTHLINCNPGNNLTSNGMYFIETQVGSQRKHTPFVFSGY